MLRAIDRLFQATAASVFHHPIKAALVVLLFLAASLSSLPQVRTDGRIEAFMHEDDPALVSYHQMRRQFGQDNRIVLTVGARDIFKTEFLEKLKELHREIAFNVPYIAEIFSPYNIPLIQYDAGGIYMEEAVRNMLLRGEDPREMRERIVNTPLYQNFVVSRDGDYAAIIVEPYRFAPHESDCVARPEQGVACPREATADVERELLGPPQYREMAERIRAIAAKYEDPKGFNIHISGAPVVSTEIVNLMSTDMPRFTMLCVGIALLAIMVLHRHLLVAAAALFAFLTSILSVFGLMAFSGTAITPPTQLLIPLVLVVSLCSFIHFVSSLFRARADTGSKAAAIKPALARCHAPIMFSALTTAAGLVAFTSSALAPISSLGLFGAVGVLIAYAMSMFSALVAFRLIREKYFTRRTRAYPRLTGRLTAVSVYASTHPKRVLAATAAIVLLCAGGIRFLEYSHNALLWLPQDNEVRRDTFAIDAAMQGTVNLEVVVEPKGERDFRDAELMRTVDAAAREAHAATEIDVGRHTSIIDFVKETNQALNDGDPAAHKVPSQEAIWDELLMLESVGNDDMQRYVTIDYDAGRVSFLTPWLEAKRYTAFIDTVQTLFERRLGDMAEVQTTGLIGLLAITSTAVLDSMTTSYTIALVLVTVLMCICLGRLGLGLLSMIPNIVPFGVLLAVMGALSIPIDTFTVLIGSIITGLIVDDTVHFFFRYKENLRRLGSFEAAVQETIQDIGLAIFTTTVVVVGGFAVFMASSLNNVQSLGLLMMLGSFVALLADLVIAPALLALLARKAVPAGEAPMGLPAAAGTPNPAE